MVAGDHLFRKVVVNLSSEVVQRLFRWLERIDHLLVSIVVLGYSYFSVSG